MEETFAGCLCVATTGAAGDNHPLLPESGFATAEAMGTRLAQQAITRCYDSVPADYDERLRFAYADVSLKVKDEATRQMLPEEGQRRPPPQTLPSEFAVQVSLLGIGPILLAGFPGEPVAELGAVLKWFSPFLKTYTLFTATECLGYFPTRNQFYWGGYEPDTTAFAAGSGERLVACILETAQRLVSEQPLVLPAVPGSGVDGMPR